MNDSNAASKDGSPAEGQAAQARTLPENPGSRRALKIALAIALVAALAVGGYSFRETLTLDNLAAREADLRQFCASHPVLTLAIAFLLYAAVTGLSIPGSVPLSLAYGWLFGFGIGVVLVSFASTTGATIAFLLSRYFLGGWVQSRFGDRLATFNRAMDREGAFYLLTLRLIPQVPFFVINVVMGLTKIRVGTYWWVSQVGMLPATCIFVWAGSSVDTLTEIQKRGLSSVLSLNTALALAALGLFPLALRWAFGYFRPRKD
jgi:uncharacterized membrane protein YdjX (TVP38/TMEM64 family)